ncbi:hypothetical protein C8R44DRAFT_846856 [Mycena epipterygia]|nr:hypothetical protein C8R44DRAFT_846856 [Mycena epipterygia]
MLDFHPMIMVVLLVRFMLDEGYWKYPPEITEMKPRQSRERTGYLQSESKHCFGLHSKEPPPRYLKMDYRSDYDFPGNPQFFSITGLDTRDRVSFVSGTGTGTPALLLSLSLALRGSLCATGTPHFAAKPVPNAVFHRSSQTVTLLALSDPASDPWPNCISSIIRRLGHCHMNRLYYAPQMLLETTGSIGRSKFFFMISVGTSIAAWKRRGKTGFAAIAFTAAGHDILVLEKESQLDTKGKDPELLSDA